VGDVAYFIRRCGDVCSVIELSADSQEVIVQDGLSPLEAEILCEMKIADISEGHSADARCYGAGNRRAEASSFSATRAEIVIYCPAAKTRRGFFVALGYSDWR
jgi:hypothetical protein